MSLGPILLRFYFTISCSVSCSNVLCLACQCMSKGSHPSSWPSWSRTCTCGTLKIQFFDLSLYFHVPSHLSFHPRSKRFLYYIIVDLYALFALSNSCWHLYLHTNHNVFFLSTVLGVGILAWVDSFCNCSEAESGKHKTFKMLSSTIELNWSRIRCACLKFNFTM